MSFKKDILKEIEEIKNRLGIVEDKIEKQDDLQVSVDEITAQISLEVGNAFFAFESSYGDFKGTLRKITRINEDGKIFYDEKILESDSESESAKYSVAEKAVSTSSFLNDVVNGGNFVAVDDATNNLLVSYMSKRLAEKLRAKAATIFPEDAE